MLVVLEPVLPDVTVQMKVIVSGVTFEDGTIVKNLTASDFDELGACKVRAILPAHDIHGYPALCHVSLLYQGSMLIGGR